MYYIPLLLTIISNVVYHIAQKNTSKDINPMFSLMVTYSIALVFSAIIFFLTKGNETVKMNFKELNWSSFVLGLAIIFLELGFLLAYRVGWNIGTSSIISTILVTITLIPIGIIFFKEDINIKNIIGIGLSIVGIILMNTK